MTIEDKTTKHGTGAIVAASAVVTLAAGVTVAALSGHLTPRSQTHAGAVTAQPPNAAPTPKKEAPGVVLVPVTRDQATQPPATRERGADPYEPVVVAYRENEGDDERGGWRRHEREDDEHEGWDHREREREDDDDR